MRPKLNYNAEDHPQYKKKMRSDDRIFVLKPIEGSKVYDTKGLVDKRLFKGENNLHAKRDRAGTWWTVEYDSGTIPTQFQQKFTSFNKLKEFVRVYYNKRGVEIVEIKD